MHWNSNWPFSKNLFCLNEKFFQTALTTNTDAARYAPPRKLGAHMADDKEFFKSCKKITKISLRVNFYEESGFSPGTWYCINKSLHAFVRRKKCVKKRCQGFLFQCLANTKALTICSSRKGHRS